MTAACWVRTTVVGGGVGGKRALEAEKQLTTKYYWDWTFFSRFEIWVAAENYDINDDEVDGDGFEAEENERTATATIADVSLDEPKRKCKSKVDMIKEMKKTSKVPWKKKSDLDRREVSLMNLSDEYFVKSNWTRVKISAARLSEISQNVRNFILIADRNFRNFGHEILPKNARNFIFGQKAPENVRILAKIWFF